MSLGKKQKNNGKSQPSQNTQPKLWHSLSEKEVFTSLDSSKKGLSSQNAEESLKLFGPNKLPEQKKLSGFLIFINQFKSPLVYVLVGAALLSVLLQDYVDASIIALAVFVNTVVGFYQENKANNAIIFLRKLMDQQARVIRDEREIQIPASQVVPGDIMILAPGDKIVADGRIIESDNLTVIEAALTGESAPSEKTTGALEPGMHLAERENMVYSGTVVASGKAIVVVCETGVKTQLGAITQLVDETHEEATPLQIQLGKFSKRVTYAVILVCVLIIIIGTLQGKPLFGLGNEAREGMFNTAAAIAVAAIPEGLLVAVTAILAIGMQAILRKKALVRRLIAAETLGSASIICTDKTGTLTEGDMRVSKIIAYETQTELVDSTYEGSTSLRDHELLLKMALLCNDTVIENPDDELAHWKTIGTPTETALLKAAVQAGIPFEIIRKEQKRFAEIPFSSDTKFMVTLNALDKKRVVAYAKGAPEKIFSFCNRVRVSGKKLKLTKAKINKLTEQYEKLTNQGLRVLAFAYKQYTAKPNTINLQEDLEEYIFAGFIALKDPLRKEAKMTIQAAQAAGIRPIVVTGDHKLTAKAIVAELGLRVTDDNILEGSELDEISDAELLERVKSIDIYARVEPRHKLRIVHAWQKHGEVVAMTGDGVNDAPALKAADIGIALGSGTDVAKETSDIILLDNNFKTIIAAIERGRGIYENVKKVTLYLLVNSFAEVILVTGSLLFGMPLPILPAQIIWINLIADGPPAMAMTFEKGDKELMQDKPRKRDEKIFNKEMKTLILLIGFITDLILFLLFVTLYQIFNLEIDHIRTLIFASLGFSSLLYVFSCRSLRHSIFTTNPFSNIYLIIGVALGFLLLLAALYVPFFQNIFETRAPLAHEWFLISLLGVVKILGIEIGKYFLIIRKQKPHLEIAQ